MLDLLLGGRESCDNVSPGNIVKPQPILKYFREFRMTDSMSNVKDILIRFNSIPDVLVGSSH